jgi:hypothetical protein
LASTGGSRLQLADELGFDPLLNRAEAQHLEAGDLAPREGVVGEIGERAAAPERERLGERGRSFLRLAPARLGAEPLEAGESERGSTCRR